MVCTSSYVGLELDWIDFGNDLGLILDCEMHMSFTLNWNRLGLGLT